VPAYIAEGLQWLSQQICIEADTPPVLPETEAGQ
jgi:hypothetical protein